MLIIRRISKIFATIVIYIVCAYGYLTAKGFIFTENGPILSNRAVAKEMEFSKRVTGNVTIGHSQIRELGDNNAPLVIYSYSSMTCAHCKDFHNSIFPKLEKDFISNGKVKFVFIHFPLEALSMRAAKLSYCMPEDKYYPFISELYNNRDWQFSEKDDVLNKYAEAFGLTPQDIKSCEKNKKLTSDILMTRDSAIKDFGIPGTPAFIVEGKDGKELILGFHGYNKFKDYLNKRLNEEK